MTLKTKLKESEITKEVLKNFTIDYSEDHEFCTHNLDFNAIPKNFNVGLLVGSSGSGKSILLKEFGSEEIVEWSEEEAVCSHFDTYDEAVDKLIGVGFNSIPHWLVPQHILSNGQKYRVNMARRLESNTVFDEFTSVIDRNTAMSMCNSINKLVKNKKLSNIVFASPHRDIIEYLQPCWVYDTDNRTLTINSNLYELKNLDEKTFVKKHFMEFKLS